MNGYQQARRIAREMELSRRGKLQRHWRYTQAVRAHRVERRLGHYLTDDQIDRLWVRADALSLREFWLRSGGHLIIKDGRLDLSEGLRQLTPEEREQRWFVCTPHIARRAKQCGGL